MMEGGVIVVFFLLYLAGGAIVGVLAGLLGVGGGIVIVPMLNLIFPWAGMSPDQVQHLSVGTSFAAIVFTSISSVRAHNARGGVRWDIWRGVTPAIVAATLFGSWVAAGLSTTFLRVFFACFLTVVGIQMLLAAKPRPSRELPGKLGLAGAGAGIGLISSFVGIGGGTMSVPCMTWCNVPMRVAVGTSAAIGFPIALTGALGYIWNGWGSPDLPEWALGFVYLPGLVGIVAGSVLTVPLGASLAHRLQVNKLKRFFGLFVCVMAARMFWTVFF